MKTVKCISSPCHVKGVAPIDPGQQIRTLVECDDLIQVSLPCLLQTEVKEAIIEFHRDRIRCFCCVVLARKDRNLKVDEVHVYSQRMAKAVSMNDKRFEAYVAGYNQAFMIPVYTACNDGSFHCGIFGQPWLDPKILSDAVAAMHGPVN
jgi:hypothetical protein